MHKERTQEYNCSLFFNSQLISQFTITDHYQLKHSAVINNDLICQLVNKLDGKDLDPEPKKNEIDRDVYV